MERSKFMSCSWLQVDGAKELIRGDKQPSEAIAKLMRYMLDTYALAAVRIHQPASRKNSTQVTHELLGDRTIPRRLNQVITLPSDYVRSLDTPEFRIKIYDNSTEPNPVSGSVNEKYVTIFLKQIFNGEFSGILELTLPDETRYPSEKDEDVLVALGNLMFEQILLYEKKSTPSIHGSSGEVLDYLTGLHRYETFVDNLDTKISELVDDDHALVIVCSDINHFKLVNENLGYRKGDELLRATGQIILEIPDLVDACRFYSDNFIMAVRSSSPDISRIRSRIESNNQKNSEALQVMCSDTQIRINSGIYVITDPKLDAASAISYANTARKRAKVFNGVHAVVFTEAMIEELRRSDELNNELPKAIRNHNIMVYYQPKISCADETITGAEALVRWRRDDGSFIYPDQFIPQFENNGNIIRLDYFVYDEVFKFLRNRLDNNVSVVPISMNVSRRHLENEDILFYIEHLINKYDMDPKYLEFELTESIYIDNVEPALNFISRCNQMGIKVSMDDFGSGYSSLNMISSIPIDVLKIDGVFMHRGKTLNDNDKIVLNNVINMAKELKMVVLCEGVETREQVDFLKEAGCDVIQGYFFGKPMPETDFEEFMEQFA
ncbi:MAG: bifunctional diguanylate cyclase/phosphodiesterase [Eubacterium sp.]|nr:bifunctional diguanylate cyclase/phosphodiesterase [Eubacterium sp.]